MALALAVPAFAIEESEVEAAVNATSREEVTGNVLIWFLCAVAFLKVSQKIDSFMSSIGVNVGHTGGSMLAEAMVAARGISVATGATGKVIGGFGKGGSGAKGERGSAGFSGIFHGGLAGMVSRKVTNDAVKTATNTTEKAASSSSRETQAASAVHTATHAATATQTVGATSKSATSHTATAQRSDSAGRTERTSESTRHQSTSGHTQTASAVHRSSQQTSLGGKLFMSSMLTGGAIRQRGDWQSCDWGYTLYRDDLQRFRRTGSLLLYRSGGPGGHGSAGVLCRCRNWRRSDHGYGIHAGAPGRHLFRPVSCGPVHEAGRRFSKDIYRRWGSMVQAVCSRYRY